MKSHLKRIFLATTICSVGIAAEPGPYEQFFTSQAMRLDYFHTGDVHKELYSIDEVYCEPLWAGSRVNLIDTLNLGKYLLSVYDARTHVLIYSRGFCSIFGEWKTTEEARFRSRSFSESVIFPFPKRPVKVTLSERDKFNIFQECWSVTLDPGDDNVRRTRFHSDHPIHTLQETGGLAEKVDLLILPDGYTQSEMSKFIKDADRLCTVLFNTEPFRRRKKAFNVRLLLMPSVDSGIDNPRQDVFKDNALSCSFNSFNSDRYVLSWDNKTIRKAASRVPYDHLYILVNSAKYGGGGIFNLYSTCISDNEWSDYIFVHEFGHSFGGLGDEYYSSSVAYSDFYPLNIEPWEPNVTALLKGEPLKWADLVKKGTPIPTPWNKTLFDSLGREKGRLRQQETSTVRADSMKDAQDQWIHDFLRNETHWGEVGAYEGSGYASEGLYRPYLDCRMFTRSRTGFCPVCEQAIERVIDFYSEH